MVGLSEMDSGSIVFAGRTGRGGKAARGCYGGEEKVGGGRAVLRRCRGGRVESGGRGVEQEAVAMAGERPAFLREIFLRRVAESDDKKKRKRKPATPRSLQSRG